MRQADAAPGEDGAEGRDGEEPVEQLLLYIRVGHKGQQADRHAEKNGHKGAAAAVDVGQDARGLALVGEGGQGATGAEDGAVADAEHRDEDNAVHDGRKNLDAGALDSDDKGGRSGVGDVSGQQAFRVVRNQEADDGQGHDVEERDAPKDLLDGRRERFSRVGRLGGGEADELRTGKRKGGLDKDGAEPLEAIVECARVVPILGPDVSLCCGATDIYDDAQESVKCLRVRTKMQAGYEPA